jgi:hypothetical protein
VAVKIVDAIQRQRRYVFTDDHAAAEAQNRLKAIVAAKTAESG